MLVDRLAPRALVDDLDPEVVVVDVGKTAGHHPLPQEEINRLLVEHAQAGRRVVRLKGGDPFVLGRGGEEALACLAAGVPVEVVPGRDERDRGAGRRGHPGHPPRPVPAGHDRVRSRGARLGVAGGAGGHPGAAHGCQRRSTVAAAELVAHGKPATTPVAIVESGFSPAAADHGRHPRRRSPSWPASATCSPRPSSSSAPWWTCTRSWGDRSAGAADAGGGGARQPGPGGRLRPPRRWWTPSAGPRPGLTVLEAYLDHASPPCPSSPPR